MIFFMQKVKNFVKFNLLAILLFFTSFSSVYAKTVLSDNFVDFFPPEIFVLFPPATRAFDTNLLQFNISIFNFDKSIAENEEVIEIKYVYFPNFLPEIKSTDKDEYRYTNNYSMRFFRSEYSTIAIQVDPNGITTRIYKDDSSIRQCKYDEQERLFYEVVWDEKKSNLIKQVFYSFSDDEKSVPDFSVEKNYERNFAFLNFYNEKGLVVKNICYELESQKDEKSKDDKSKTEKSKVEKSTVEANVLDIPSRQDLKGKKIVETKQWEFDDKNHAIKTVLKKDGRTLSIQKDYEKDFAYPDEYISENGKLKSRKIYSSDSDYEIEIFLENGFSIKSVYVGSQLEKNVFYKDGKFIREVVKE